MIECGKIPNLVFQQFSEAQFQNKKLFTVVLKCTKLHCSTQQIQAVDKSFCSHTKERV